MESIRILGTGSFVPPNLVTNDDLVRSGLDTSDEWITKRTGVRERRIADPDVVTTDLALPAAMNALEAAGMTAKDLELIIVATVTPDSHCPSAANWLQAKLDAPRAATFDVTAACSGFIYAMNIAEQYLKNKTVGNVLIVGAEIMTRVVDWNDRSSCVLWGDGAGAAVLALGDSGPEILWTQIGSDGSNGHTLLFPGAGSMASPVTHETVDEGRHYLRMIEGKTIFRAAVNYFADGIKQAAAANDIPIDKIDWIIPHQANIRMFQNISQSMDIPMERFYLTLQKYGNISAASCAIALDEAARNGSLKKGQYICMPVFGGGLTWGSAMIRW